MPRAPVLATAATALLLLLPTSSGLAQPAPDERISTSPTTLAQRLAEVTDDTNRAADAWLATPEATRAEPRDQIAALRDLFRLGGAPPSKRRRLRIGVALPPAQLRAYYAEAERRFAVPWHILAAVNLVETNFNRVRSPSTVGALGPMQFLPATWRAYGLGGNVRDPRDAILGAANYLRASGAPRNMRRALFAYNHSTLYVNAVLRFAGRIRQAPRNYIALWSWQAFQRTPARDRQLSGPR